MSAELYVDRRPRRIMATAAHDAIDEWLMQLQRPCIDMKLFQVSYAAVHMASRNTKNCIVTVASFCALEILLLTY